MLPNSNGAVVTILGLMTAGRVPADDQLHQPGPATCWAACKAAEIKHIVTSRVFVEKGRLDKPGGGASPACGRSSTLEGRAHKPSRAGDKIRAPAELAKTAGATQGRTTGPRFLFTSGSEGRAERRRAPPTATSWRTPRRPRRAIRLSAARTRSFQRAAGVPTRSGSRSVSCFRLVVRRADLSLIRRRCITATVAELVYGVNATILFGTDTFLNGYSRVAHALRFPLACATSWPGAEAGEGNRPVRPTWRNSGCASWKDMASLETRGRCWRSTTPMFKQVSAPSDASCPGMEGAARQGRGVSTDGGTPGGARSQRPCSATCGQKKPGVARAA